jgi:hypothetical protein
MKEQKKEMMIEEIELTVIKQSKLDTEKDIVEDDIVSEKIG